MTNLSESFRSWIETELKPQGAIGAFVKKTGFSRSSVEDWRDGKTTPKLQAIDDAATELGVDPLTLVSGGRAIPKEKLDEAEQKIAELKARIETLQEALENVVSVRDRRILQTFRPHPKSDERLGTLGALAALDDDEFRTIIEKLDSINRVKASLDDSLDERKKSQ